MELQACVLAVKMSCMVQAEWNQELTAVYYWCDSTAALGFIFNLTKRVLLYVHNRAEFIREHTDIHSWRYISTERNPADIASRGINPSELPSCDLWFHGPVEEMRRASELPVARVELLVSNPEVVQKATVLCTTVQPKPWILAVAERFSSWRKVIGVVTNLLTWPDKFRGLEESRLSTMKRAEKMLIKATQEYYLAPDLQFYKKKEIEVDEDGEIKTVGKVKVKGSDISSLDPFVDREGILRVGGRCKRSSMMLGAKHPVILPPHSHVSKLLIEVYHEAIQHQSANWTLGRLRQTGFWVVRGRQVISAIVRKCVKCIRARGREMRPKMSDLPVQRLEASPPFTYTGMDVFGPFHVKVARSQRKRWLIIFACMACRGVHLEVLDSLDTSSFINSYRRFAGRRGPIQGLWSDRGTNFISGKNELEAQVDRLDPDKVKRELELRGCDWLQINFNVPKALNMGGAWERLISTVRAALFQTLVQHGDRLTDNILATAAVEAECIMNSRPSAYIDNGMSEDPTPISPSAILTLKTDVVHLLPGKFDDSDKYAKSRWKYVQLLAQYFWGRWKREVIMEQQKRIKWKSDDRQVQVGDVLIMTDKVADRKRWPMARVVEVYPSHDGCVRKMKVRMGGRDYDRPVNKAIHVMSTDSRIDANPP